jgi:hypothetical protein
VKGSLCPSPAGLPSDTFSLSDLFGRRASWTATTDSGPTSAMVYSPQRSWKEDIDACCRRTQDLFPVYDLGPPHPSVYETAPKVLQLLELQSGSPAGTVQLNKTIGSGCEGSVYEADFAETYPRYAL